MGLTTFAGNQLTLKEAKIVKNYLNEKELKTMGQLVSGYLDFVERQAQILFFYCLIYMDNLYCKMFRDM